MGNDGRSAVRVVAHAFRAAGRGLRTAALLLPLVFGGCSDPPPPDPDVLVGSEVLRKDLFYAAQDGWVSGLQVAELDGTRGSELLVTFSRSFDIVDAQSGALERSGRIALTRGRLTAIGGRGADPFLLVSSVGCYRPVGLMDSEGRALWSYKPYPRRHIPRDMTVGDLDGDGEPEFYVATWRGLHCLDAAGRPAWQAAGPKGLPIGLKRVRVLEPEWADQPLVAALSHPRTVGFWDGAGNLVRMVTSQTPMLELEPCDWPSPNHLMTTTGRDIVIMDMDCQVVFQHSPEDTPSGVTSMRCTPVRFAGRDGAHLAVLMKFFPTTHRAILFVFSPDGELVYQELLEPSEGLCTVRDPQADADVLLVGNGPAVYAYHMR